MQQAQKSRPRSTLSLAGAALLCLGMFATGCASAPPAQQRPGVQCQHPTINPETNAGLVRGVLRYAEALDECSIQNSGAPGATPG